MLFNGCVSLRVLSVCRPQHVDIFATLMGFFQHPAVIYFCTAISLCIGGKTFIRYCVYQCTVTVYLCFVDWFIMRPSQEAALRVSPSPSVRLSVPCLQFSRNKKAIETSNLVESQRLTSVTRGANLSSKGQRSSSLGTKM